MTIKIDVWSDVVCPWCYIGKRNLELGIEEYKRTPDQPEVEVEFHSFELSPDTPVGFVGTPREYLTRTKGISPEQVEVMIERVIGIAAGVGLVYNYDTMQHTNTVRAHQLLHHAKQHGVQGEMKERLMLAFFTEGRHVGDIDDLADLAAEVGLDRDDVVRSLETDEFLGAVRADQAQAQEHGIGGVPFFILDGRYGLSGAQPPDVFARALAHVASEIGEARELA